VAPIAQAITLLLATIGTAHAQQAFSNAWFAARGAAQATAAQTGRLPNGMPVTSLMDPSAQQQQANAQLQRSIANLGAAAQNIAAMQAAQASARAAATGSDTTIPDGLTEGGLKVDTNSLTQGWINAQAPTQSTSNGKTSVNIQQTADKAILNWETFNVGRNTSVNFAQQNQWAALNRVNDPRARPSQIQGQIHGDGTVLIVNRNGVIFGGTSQVDVRNLVVAAARISDAQFRTQGIYGVNANTPSFTDALGKIEVQPGATITTRTPTSVTQGGGYVLMLGAEVSNGGTITTPRGQVQMAAGDFFIVRPGLNTATNTYSTTRGNEVSPQFAVNGVSSGTVVNSGLLQATEGDITLAGRNVVQDGVAVATTTVDTRGTIHLLTSASDKLGSVTTTARALNAVLLDSGSRTALDSQRDGLLADSAKQDLARRSAAQGLFDNLSLLDDRRDQSRIEIVSGGRVVFEGGSMTLATGGQLAVSAIGTSARTTVQSGARLDVSGAVGVQVEMSSNNVAVNVQGNEQRDSPLNRDSGLLNSTTVWIDRRRLTHVAAGVGGYDKDRWYTSGGLLEVGGYLGLSPRSVGEWMAQGGSVAFAGNEVVTQAGSNINLSGGTFDVRTGYLNQTWLKGADGGLYEVSSAPTDVRFTGIYRGFEAAHPRWGDKTTDYYASPLIGPAQRLENGYTVGRDAGRLNIATNAAVLDGDITATVYQGPRQSASRDITLDGYSQSQNAAPLAGQLVLGNYRSAINTDPKNGPTSNRFNLTPTFGQIVFDDAHPDLALALDDALPQDRKSTLYLDTSRLNGWGLGAITAAATQSLTVQNALNVASGGSLRLLAPQVDVNANLTARGGDIMLGNAIPSTAGSGVAVDVVLPAANGSRAHTTIANGVTLDTSGLWTNLANGSDADVAAGAAFANGGRVIVRSTGDVTLASGAGIDVTSGGVLRRNGTVAGATGGDVTLAAGFVSDINATPLADALLTLDGKLRGFGTNGGGTLTLQSGTGVVIGGQSQLTDGVLHAGQSSQLNLRLLDDYHLKAGDVAPMDLKTIVTRRPAGYVVPATVIYISLGAGESITTQADWRVPLSMGNLTDNRGHVYLAGELMRAGTVIVGQFQLPRGFQIPGDVFPNGLPVPPIPESYFAGSVLAVDVTLAAGTSLTAGAVLTRDVRVAMTGVLDPARLQSGFSRYLVGAADGVAVAPGTKLDVTMPLLRTDALQVQSLASGGRLADVAPVWTPSLYQEDPLHAKLTQRAGASLGIDAGSRVGLTGTGAPITINTGATVSVDPGQSIALWSNGGQITVDGSLNAWGGNVSLQSLPITQSANFSSLSRSIWVGDTGVIDVAARPYIAYDALGRPYGIAPDGGNIDFGLSDAFIVLRPGARLNASGASAQVDGAAGGSGTLASRPVFLAGNGGSIALRSYVGMVLDGSMTARAGGAGAAGGSLTVEMANRLYNANTETIAPELQTLHNLTLVQQHQRSSMSADAQAGRANAALKFGATTLGADQVMAGGFDTLSLATHDLFIFSGDVDLSLGRSINLRNGMLTVADDTPNAHVRLAAPYVRFDGGTWVGQQGYFAPGFVSVYGGAPVAGTSSLTVDARLVDIAGEVLSGVVGEYGDGATLPGTIDATQGHKSITAKGFSNVALNIDTDLRLTDASFYAGGDLKIDAAQLYPTSASAGAIYAGLRGFAGLAVSGNDWDFTRSLVIRTHGEPAPVPDSAFGRLIIEAPFLDQGGIVRAPLGTIALNDTGATNYVVRPQPNGKMQLVLRDGSLTSVSAAGLVMPYGGTQDGLTYRGADGTLYSLAGNAVNYAIKGDSTKSDLSALAQGISLGGGSVVAEKGSVLDLSGGGDLRGAGFISGRGGSVDVLTTSLSNANPAAWGTGGAKNTVYAIVPGYASDYAPLIADKGAGDPAIGRQITLDSGVPGLPAGTYTLLPASFALMPGAWRVEVGARLGALVGSGALPDALVNGSGSWSTTGKLKTAGTTIADALSSRVTLTPGTTVRHYSQYNETSYTDFALSQAALFGNTRPMLPVDGKVLRFNVKQNDALTPLTLDGTTRLDGAKVDTKNGVLSGARAQVSVIGDAPIDLVGPDARPTPGNITLSADALSGLRASALTVGSLLLYVNGQTSDTDGARVYTSAGQAASVNVRDGAVLRAGQIFLSANNVNVDTGATLDTRGMGQPAADSRNGFLYSNTISAQQGPYAPAIVAIGNGWLDFLPALGSGRATIGDGATLLTEGTLALAAPGSLTLGNANLGARYLTVTQDQINVGTSASFAAAQTAGNLRPGWRLTQDVLDKLLHPSVTANVPALERLSLTAGGAFNFYGGVTLDTGSSPVQMVFNTPAFYGLGTSGDTVRIATRNFVWNGIATGAGTAASPYTSVTPTPVLAGGPGTGAGALLIDADTVTFGYDAMSAPQRQAELSRVALGFAGVTLRGATQITANNKGTLGVGQTQDADGVLHDGTLRMETPLLTGRPGASMRYTAGGDLSVVAPQGAGVPDTSTLSDLGASVALTGRTVTLDTTVALPTGTLSVTADGDLVLGDRSRIDLSGREIHFFDVARNSWGGTASLTSRNGNVTQSAGSHIDVSAAGEHAGMLNVSAEAGTASLAGKLDGHGGKGAADGDFDLRVRTMGDAEFSALNAQLNTGGFFDARSFALKQGDLTVGDGVRARKINIATDTGSLTVDGTLDASGTGAGNIVLSAGNDLHLTPRAVLDMRVKTLLLDGYGQPIDASNRSKISLASRAGTVRLDAGSTMDLSAPDGIARGRIEIDAARVGNNGNSATGADAPSNATGNDVAISAAGPITIRGAQRIALNGVARYTNAPTDPDNANGQAIDQAYLDLIDQDSRVFDTGARNNTSLAARMAGLSAYGDAFHLRPGVEIASRTPDGDLTVKGDLDLSGYRYGPAADRNLASATYGAGEPMSLAIRAGGNLTVKGSINDGFVPPPATPDDNNWQLFEQVLLSGQATTHDTSVTLPFNAALGDVIYAFPSYTAGTGYPVVVSGSVTDDFGTYGPGDVITNGFLYGHVTVTAGTVMTSDIPGGADIVVSGPRPEPGRMWTISPMLAAGSQSASIRLVSGADLSAADARRMVAASQLGDRGDLVLDDLHVTSTTSLKVPSVIRTGTGDLELFAGNNFRQNTLFGVYTAGTQVPGTGVGTAYDAPRARLADGSILGSGNGAYEATLNPTRMWITDGAGDFTLAAQRDIVGFQQSETTSVGDWLWRQGGAEIGQRTAWGINFGSYTADVGTQTYLGMVAFSGVGSLGGGNATIRAGGNIGVPGNPSRGITAAVGASGRVSDGGTVMSSGGGTLDVVAGGEVAGGFYVNVRGDTRIGAADVGSLVLKSYATPVYGDPRPADPYTAYNGARFDAVHLGMGDGRVRIETQGDLVVGQIVDPGRTVARVETQASTGTGAGAISGSAATWFTLWTDRTALDMFAAGGNASPFGLPNADASGKFDINNTTSYSPSKISAVAAGGSIYYAAPGDAAMLMPSPGGYLDLLARGTVSADRANDFSFTSTPIGPVGASLSSLATPLHAAWRIVDPMATAPAPVLASNYWADPNAPFENVMPYVKTFDPGLHNYLGGGTLFTFGPNTLTDHSASGDGVSHIYAVEGDVVGLLFGKRQPVMANGVAGQPYVQASKPVRVLAGGDILSTSAVFGHDSPSDVSMIAARGSVIFTDATVAGPGTLEISAGGQMYQGFRPSLTSLGAVIPGDTRAGADIVVQAGLGNGAPGVGATDFTGFAAKYLDPSNLMNPSAALADQPGKVVKVYDAELTQWLSQRFGYVATSTADAIAYFNALAPEQQRVFVRNVFYAELRDGGREYNDAQSRRFGSYLRGRDAIATLFPATDSTGAGIVRNGDITLFQGDLNNSGIRTVAGGNIQTLAPGGTTIVGVENLAPSTIANPAGLITQGEGDIDMFGSGSILLGQSRIMTTFGGAILAWSAQGDINAGRGSKTTLTYTPPKREYDSVGNVKISPNVPASGAGIATLNPLPEVPPGDVDLIAPLGTIDAGEAGIRVSGNVNFAALQIVNAANVQVQGKSTGLPVVAAVNVGALTNASATAAQAASAAQDAVARERVAQRQNTPSIFSVRMLSTGGASDGTGNGNDSPQGRRTQGTLGYNGSSLLQLVGSGNRFDPRQMARLTEEERHALATH